MTKRSLRWRRFARGSATIAVLGNHDHWRDAPAARRALARAGIRLLENQAVQIGPLAVGGLDDDFTGRADLPATLAALRRLEGPKLILSHSPDPFADPAPDVFLMLAGHTHCGQIAPPLIGPLSTMSDYGRRYACGLVREGGRTLVVTAGLGTSGIPLRLGAVPDLWLVEIGPASNPPRRSAFSGNDEGRYAGTGIGDRRCRIARERRGSRRDRRRGGRPGHARRSTPAVAPAAARAKASNWAARAKVRNWVLSPNSRTKKEAAATRKGPAREVPADS